MKVVIVVAEQVSLFELASAVELFALPRPEFKHWYSTDIVAFGKTALSGLCDSTFSCRQVTQLPECDLLVIPSFPVSITTIDSTLKHAVLQHYQKGGRIISFCSGSFLLAALGLLNGRIATTHWRYASTFKQRFPHVTYQEDILYHYDGIIGCSAGSAAGLDLGIEVIRQDFGYHVANTVARRLVLPAHRNGGQSQFVEKPLPQTKSSVSQALDWAVKHLSPELTIDDIANKASMTRRTFDRHFKKHYHMTPLEWLQARKLEVAKSLLETTQLGLDHIAERAGFDNAITLRYNFRKYLSISPSEYKATFGALKNA
ncbi:helix-turn-helix domain-containing protein [Alteromonas sp. AMM-1]|uniref:helix-turn-helix domain-containing protein n=1 Tax=Alteromonas sp. AMM-1 TaxID=3394233 RepID=UPI0039A4B028